MEVTKVIERSRTIERLLFEVVDETRKQVFGEDGPKVIYEFMKNSHLEREEIAEKAEVFSAGLKKRLSLAAPVIEKLFIKICTVSYSLSMRRKTGFSDCTRELRNSKFDRKRYSVSAMLRDDGRSLGPRRHQ